MEGMALHVLFFKDLLWSVMDIRPTALPAHWSNVLLLSCVPSPLQLLKISK